MAYEFDKVFSKEKVLARLKEAGKEELIDDEVMAILENLDGRFIITHWWNLRAEGAPMYGCVGEDGEYFDVNEEDQMDGEDWCFVYRCEHKHLDFDPFDPGT